MKKNFFKFLLLGAFTLSLGAGFVGCKDYDDDIDEIWGAIKDLQDFQAKVGSSVTDITFNNGILTAKKLDGTTATIDLKTYFVYDIKVEDGKLMVNGSSVGEVGGGGVYDFAIEDGNLVITLNGEEYKTLPLDGSGSGIAIETDPDTGEIIKVEAVSADGKKATLWVAGSSADPGALITGFDVLYVDGLPSSTLNFGTATAAVNYVFGATYPGAITFVKNSAGEDAEAVVTVKVNPASALLNAASISLQDSKKNTEIMNYVQVSEVKRTEKLITKAGAESGLWDITLKMKSDVDKVAFHKLVGVVAGSKTAYALVIENALAGGTDERFVVGHYILDATAADKAPKREFNFNVTQGAVQTVGTSIGVENVSAHSSLDDKKWDGTLAWAASNVGTAGRSATAPLLSVEAGQNLSIDLTTNADDVYAYYVTFDTKRAAIVSGGVVSPDLNLINAWNGYGVTGLKNVVKAKDGKISVNIPAAALNAKIGFNVMAVNYDGHLLDPDGIPFWVIVGGEVAPAGTVTLPMNVTTRVATQTEAKPTDKVAFNPGFVATDNVAVNTASVEFSLTTESITYNYASAGVSFFQTNGTTAATTGQAIAQMQLISLQPFDMLIDKEYSGTLTFKNALGAIVKTFTVKVSKADVNFPSAFKLKSIYTAPEGVLDVILNNGTNAAQSSAAFNMANYFEAGTLGFTNFKFAQDVTDANRWIVFGTTGAATAPATISGNVGGGATPPTSISKIGSGATPLKVTYDWGWFNPKDVNGADVTAGNPYAKTWASPTVAKLNVMSSVQAATLYSSQTWNTYNYSDNFPLLPAGITATRSKFLFGWDNTNPASIRLADLTVTNPNNNNPFHLTRTGGGAWSEFNIFGIEFALVAEGANVTEELPANLADVQVPYFTLGAPAGTTSVTLSVAYPNTVPQMPATDQNLTFIMRVQDQFGNKSVWKSPAGLFQGVHTLPAQPAP